MEKFCNVLKVLWIIDIVCVAVLVIVDLVLLASGAIVGVTGFLSFAISLALSVFSVWLFWLFIHFVEETIRLRDDFENHKKASATSPKKPPAAPSGNTNKWLGSATYNNMLKYTEILPAAYMEEGEKRWIAVDGKYTSREDVGVKCPFCSEISPARKSKCQKCGLEYYFK